MSIFQLHKAEVGELMVCAFTCLFSYAIFLHSSYAPTYIFGDGSLMIAALISYLGRTENPTLCRILACFFSMTQKVDTCVID